MKVALDTNVLAYAEGTNGQSPSSSRSRPWANSSMCSFARPNDDRRERGRRS